MVLSLFTMLTLVACQGKIVQNRYSADYLELFNTVSRVIGYAKNEEEFQKQSEFIHSRLKFYHEQYNAFEGYDHLNNIYTINKNAGIGPVKVDDSIIDMLEYGQEVYDETGGRVNILMGSLTWPWYPVETMRGTIFIRGKSMPILLTPKPSFLLGSLGK